MINRILEAYEAKKDEKRNWKQIYKQLSGWQKTFIIYFIGGAIALIIGAIIEAARFTIIGLWVYVAGIYILAACGEKYKYKKWETNTEKYKQDLGVIREVLKEFDVYSKNKLKQLIRKFYKDISRIEKSQNGVAKNMGTFFATYIGPVIGFIVGSMKVVSTSEELLGLGLLAIILLICGKAAIFAVGTILNELSGDPLGKKKIFVQKLQDLLDEDFEITDDDLLKSE